MVSNIKISTCATLSACVCFAAATAVCWLTREEPSTIGYFADLNNMHKVVVGVDNEVELRDLSAELEKAEICHKLWVEEPEGIMTSLATKPASRSQLQLHFKSFKLLR
jgi:peptidyl-tRNA hydrolase